MRFERVAALAGVLALGITAIVTSPAFTKERSPAMSDNPIIPRQVIFGNPERTSAQVSPDGRQISFLAPKDGVLNVWVAPLGQLDKAKPVTDEKERPIREYYWAHNSRYILYLQDKGGTEDFLLYATDPKTGKTRNLTPYEKTRAIIFGASVKHPDEILVGLNNRDPKWHDVWRFNVVTGKGTMIYKNEGFGGFVADDDLKLHYALKDQPDGGFLIQKMGPNNTLANFMTIPGEDSLTTTVFGFDVAGETLYGLDSRGRDKAALVTFDPKTAKATVIGESDKADVAHTIVDPATGKIQGYGVLYLKTEWMPIDPAIKGDLDFIASRIKGEWEITSRSMDSSLWIVVADPVTEPAYFALYDRKAKTLSRLFTIRPKLEGAPLSPMYPVVIKSRDGMDLVSYLTLPKGSDANNDGKPDAGPLPMVLYVHGGPWARDVYGYNATHQWLANRGYAVLSVNYRGSTGLGKGFTNAGDKEWGRKMHDDLLDTVDWAVKNRITTKSKAAIMGGSYGGYATLVGVTMTPKAFACGVDIVGPSNLDTLLSTIPPYWAAFFENFARRVGDPRTEEGKKLLAERSPLTFAAKIERPLLIAQGANDPRVKRAESDQIVSAMKAKNIPVTYVLYPDEGHGFAEPANRTSFYAVSEAFLSQCVGGRFEPVGDDFKGASIEVLEGVEHVPGVKAALAAGK
ncbi:MAG: S9 family peptidase [Alphaproteobacteria bacterium]